MKTKLIVEIETPDKIEIYQEEGETEEDYKGKKKQAELKEFRNQYIKDLHKEIVKRVKNFLDEECEEQFLDDPAELYIEMFDTFEQYGINISIKEMKIK